MPSVVSQLLLPKLGHYPQIQGLSSETGPEMRTLQYRPCYPSTEEQADLDEATSGIDLKKFVRSILICIEELSAEDWVVSHH